MLDGLNLWNKGSKWREKKLKQSLGLKRAEEKKSMLFKAYSFCIKLIEICKRCHIFAHLFLVGNKRNLILVLQCVAFVFKHAYLN